MDCLSDQQFPVQQVTIVGVDLMQVERVTGRLSWPKVLGGGVLTGAWLGLFIGLLIVSSSPSPWGALVTGLVAGVIFGLIASAIPYAMAGRKRSRFDDAARRRPLQRVVRTAGAEQRPGTAGALNDLAAISRERPCLMTDAPVQSVTVCGRSRMTARRCRSRPDSPPNVLQITRIWLYGSHAEVTGGREADGARSAAVRCGIGRVDDGVGGDGVRFRRRRNRRQRCAAG